MEGLKVLAVCNGAFMPQRATEGSAGYDLRTKEDFIIQAGERKKIDIGICIELPKDTYGHILPKSGLSLKGIDIGGGIIDSDYRGEIGVIMINNGQGPIKFDKGMKIAQLLIIPVCYPDILVVEAVTKTERGDGGFGSTGEK